MTPETANAFDGLLRRWVDERDLAGSVLITRGAGTVFEGCYGLADRSCGSPVTPATRFATASVTKMFTGVAVVDLVNRGLLDRFDRPVVDILPPRRRPSTLRDDVTVHHLLSHTSGIADYCEEDEDTPGYCADYGSLWDDRPSYRMQRPVDFLPLFDDLPPLRAPGLTFHYSNAGYVVLAQVVEELTGQPFIQVVEERVFAVAGMRDSGFFRLDEPVPDLAVGYLPRPSSDSPWRSNIYRVPVVGGGDGGAQVTARDAGRFISALDDGTLLGPLRDRALQRHGRKGESAWGYGYGVWLMSDGSLSHDGGDPGVEALVRRWPEHDTNLVVLCNVAGVADDIAEAAVRAFCLTG